MKIGIIGTGNIGSNLARLFVKAGHSVVLSWSRSPEKIVALSLELGGGHTAIAASVLEATQDVDLTVLSIRYAIMDEVRILMGDLDGKIIVDTNNPYDVKLPKGVSAADETERRLPGILLVKAFNTLYYELLLSRSFSHPLTVMPVCGDSQDAKQTVKELIDQVGFQPFDLGGLKNVGLQEPDGPFYNKVLSLEEAKRIRAGLR